MPRWPLNNAYFWQEAPLLRPLILLMAGIVCYDAGWIEREQLQAGYALLAVSGILSILLAFVRRRALWLDALYLLTFATFFSVLGWFSYAASDLRNRGHWAGHDLGDTTALSLVRIAEAPATAPSNHETANNLDS